MSDVILSGRRPRKDLGRIYIIAYPAEILRFAQDDTDRVGVSKSKCRSGVLT
jgi:hypothetical protein